MLPVSLERAAPARRWCASCGLPSCRGCTPAAPQAKRFFEAGVRSGAAERIEMLEKQMQSAWLPLPLLPLLPPASRLPCSRWQVCGCPAHYFFAALQHFWPILASGGASVWEGGWAGQAWAYSSLLHPAPPAAVGSAPGGEGSAGSGHG